MPSSNSKAQNQNQNQKAKAKAKPQGNCVSMGITDKEIEDYKEYRKQQEKKTETSYKKSKQK